MRDWWRWIALIPLLGSITSAVYLIDRSRLRAGLVVGTLALIQGACWITGAAIGQNDPSAPPATVVLVGIGTLLYPGLLVGIWMLAPTGLTDANGELAGGPDGPYAMRVRRPWPAVTDRARTLTVRYGLVAYVVAFGGVIVLSLILKAAGAHLGVGAGVLAVDAILLGAVAPLILRGRIGRRDLGLRPTRAGASAGLAILAFVAYLVLSAIWALIVIHTSHSQSGGATARQFGIYRYPGALTVGVDSFAMAVSAPVCEEIFFRGLLYRCLRNRMPVWAAALIAGCLFGLVHITSYPLNTIPIKMLFGVMMCLLYERTGSLLPTIAVHAAVDGTGADVIFTGNVLIAACAAAAALIGVLARMIYNAAHDKTIVVAATAAGTAAHDPALEPAIIPGSPANLPW